MSGAPVTPAPSSGRRETAPWGRWPAARSRASIRATAPSAQGAVAGSASSARRAHASRMARAIAAGSSLPGIAPLRGASAAAASLAERGGADPSRDASERAEIELRPARHAGELGQALVDVRDLEPGGEDARPKRRTGRQPAGKHAKLPESRRGHSTLCLGKVRTGPHRVAVRAARECGIRCREGRLARDLERAIASDAMRRNQAGTHGGRHPRGSHERPRKRSTTSATSAGRRRRRPRRFAPPRGPPRLRCERARPAGCARARR